MNINNTILIFIISSVFSIFAQQSNGLNDNDYKKFFNALTNENPKAELRILRNEVFAKYGRQFKSPDLQKHFRNIDWYKVNTEYHDSLLTHQETVYARFIKKVEDLFSSQDVITISDSIVKKGENPNYPDQVIDHYYNVTYKLTKMNNNKFIIEEILNYQGLFEGYMSNYNAICFNQNKKTIIWRITNSDDRSIIYGDVYLETEKVGCCGSPSTYTLYNLFTGQEIIKHFGDIFLMKQGDDIIRAIVFVFSYTLENKNGKLFLIDHNSILDSINIFKDKFEWADYQDYQNEIQIDRNNTLKSYPLKFSSFDAKYDIPVTINKFNVDTIKTEKYIICH